MKKILDIGCGIRKRCGAIGIDNNPRVSPDVLHDLNKIPYPFPDSTFDEIYADNVIEHLNDIISVMGELYRIANPGAIIRIDVPYFRAKWAFIDPTHKHFFTVDSFSYFDPEHVHNKLYPYSSKKCKVERVIFNEKINDKGVAGWLKNVVKNIANKYPGRYETYISHLFPLDELTFYLRIIK